jgi:hypothetical protein
MTRMSSAFALLPLLAVSSLACEHNVYSPPALPLPLEAPRSLNQGQTAIQAEGASEGAMLWGPDVVVGGAAVHRGFGHGTEASLGGNVVHIRGDSAAGTSPDIISARAGAKQELWGHHLSALVGLGGGHSAGGSFVSPDLGLIVGFDNPYVVPFASAHVMASVPIAARQVDTSAPPDPPGTHVDTPKTTGGYGGTFGLRIPIGDPDSESVHAGLAGGMSFWKLYSDGNDIGFLGLGGSADIIF